MTINWDEFQVSTEEPTGSPTVSASEDKWEPYRVGRKPAKLTAGDYGLLAGASGAGLLATKWAVDPFVEKLKLGKPIKAIRKELGISKNVRGLDLPKAVENKFIATMLEAEKGIIKDTANTLAQNHDAWRNGAFNKYLTDLQGIDDVIHNSGLAVPLEAETFKNEVLLKTAEQLDDVGLKKEASILRKAGKGLKTGDPIQFSQAKQTITNITKSNSKMGRVLGENFLDYLATDEVASKTPAGQMFRNLQNNYAPFKSIDNYAKELLDTKTGGLNIQKVNTALTQYVKGKGNPQMGEFLRRMGQNSAMTKGVPELSRQSAQLESIVDKVSRIRQLKIQANDIANQIPGINAKIKGRLVAAGSTAALLGGNNLLQQFLRMSFGGKVLTGLTGLGVVGQAQTAFDLWKLRNEPLQQYQRAMSGATFGLAGKPVPPMARTQQINQELAQNPQAYENAIMTPETFNFLQMRAEAEKEAKHWTRKDIRNLF